MARARGPPVEYIEAVETGRAELSIETLVDICVALGLSGAILFRKRGGQERSHVTTVITAIIIPTAVRTRLAA